MKPLETLNLTKDDGGPAFPVPPENKGQPLGLTIRDWFAGQVLAGMVSAPSDNLSQDLGPNLRAGSIEAMSNTAALAYGIADEMLRARL